MGLFHFAFMIYRAVCELKSPSMSDFLWGLENSGWLRHIKAIMDAGIFIAKVCDCEENKGETSQCMLTSDWRSRFLLKGHVPGWAALHGGWLCRPPVCPPECTFVKEYSAQGLVCQHSSKVKYFQNTLSS